jgi:formylglycine-generating enzyme required for sulfatase activity
VADALIRLLAVGSVIIKHRRIAKRVVGMKSLIAWIICLGLVLPFPCRAEQRLALLIANEKYDANVGGPLTYPYQDAENVRVSLKQLGFKVTTLRDVEHSDMVPAIRNYLLEVKEAGSNALSFFYYSGHGAATPDHENYLIPVDVKSTHDASLWSYATKQADIIRELKDGAPEAKHFLVFDACRNELNLPKAAGKGVGGDKGFGRIQERVGMLIAYATEENETAKDTGQYATILAEELLRPGIEVAQVFRNVQLSVERHMHQRPFYVMSGIGETYFTAAPKDAPCNAVTIAAENQEVCRIPGDGQQFKDCEICPEMVLIPPGAVNFYGPLGFWNSLRQFISSVDLRPVHEVDFAEAVAVSRFPITFDEWDACAADGGCDGYRPADGGWGRYGHPVVNVSWNDAVSYLTWLRGRTGQEYRLLSEAEREYLKGKDADGSLACSNCDRVVPDIIQVFTYDSKGGSGHMESKQIIVAKTRVKTLPVRAFVPNEWGLYGIKDNVDELLADCWSDITFQVIPTNGSPWTKDNCKSHTIVGAKARERIFGSPYMEYRWAANLDARDAFTGFRVARTLKP